MTKKCSTRMQSIYRKLIHNFSASKYLGLWVNDTMVMWGCFNFVVPYEGYRDNIYKTIEETKKTIPNLKLLYSSWEDWIETRGLIIEQDIENWIFSEYVKKTDLLVVGEDWSKKIMWADFLEKNNEWLYLHTVENKIYFNWRKLTSKELKSQNTTIEVLVKLLENRWHLVSNKDLTLSSYSTNKNDMVSKIISPLEKLIKEESNIKFKITCSWRVNNFTMKLEDTELDIFLIKRL